MANSSGMIGIDLGEHAVPSLHNDLTAGIPYTVLEEDCGPLLNGSDWVVLDAL